MYFSDWKEKSVGKEISKSLLWEYDLSAFDWQAMRVLVVQRVIERGWLDDFYAMLRLYGGIENVKSIIKEIPTLSPKDMNFVVHFFEIKKEELKCYTRKQFRERHLFS